MSGSGLFLLAYKVFEKNLDNTMSTVAGLSAVGVALFPTGRPVDVVVPLTPLQARLGETPVMVVHFTCAFLFVGSLATLSYFFGVREGRRDRDRPTHRALPARFWRGFHWTCAAVIVLAVLFLLVTKLVGGPDRTMLVTEVVSVLAFGASWAAKGLELDYLLGARPGPEHAGLPEHAG